MKVRKPAPITADDVAAGMVSHFDVWVLAQEREVQLSWDRVGEKPRPFLCLAVAGGRSWWTPLSSRPVNEGGFKRFRILPAWKQGGGPAFHQSDTYLFDTRDVAVIPTYLLPRLTHKELQVADRAHLTPDGLAACLREIQTAQPKQRIPVPQVPPAMQETNS